MSNVHRMFIHKILIGMSIPWDVARIIKEFIGTPEQKVHLTHEMEDEDMIKWRARYKKRAFTI
jgi:hypothetical protein